MLRFYSIILLIFTTNIIFPQNGTVKTYFPSGKVASRLSFIKDILEGASYWYYPNGNLRSEKNYVNGMLNGFSRDYFENGLMKEELHYSNGILDGICKTFYENGSLRETKHYDDGKLIKRTQLQFDNNYIAPLAAYEAGKGKRNGGEEDFICPLEICPEPVGGIEEIQGNIIYPELAMQYELEGTVMITATISTSGKAEKIKVIKGLGLGCDEAAVEAVKKTKFVPGRSNGEEVESEVTFKLKFEIKEINKESVVIEYEDVDSVEVLKEESQNFIICNTDECPQPIGGIVALLDKLRYPPQAKRNNISGDVIVSARIDEIGFVVSTEIKEGLGYGCDEAAKSAVLKTQFEPGKKNGVESESQIEIRIPFILEEKTE